MNYFKNFNIIFMEKNYQKISFFFYILNILIKKVTFVFFNYSLLKYILHLILHFTIHHIKIFLF